MEKAVRVLRIILFVLVLVALAVAVVVRLHGLLSVILISALMAYLLNKPHRKLQKWMRPGFSLLIIFGSVLGVLVLLGVYIVPLMLRQAADLIGAVPKLLNAITGIVTRPGGEQGPMGDIIGQAMGSLSARAADWLGSATLNVAQVSYSGLIWLVLIPFLVYYFLKDHRFFLSQVGYLVPIRFHNDIQTLYISVDKALGQFFRGQLLVSLIVGVLNVIGLLVVGVRSALLLGLLSGLCNMVPYVGPFIGAVPVALVASLQGWRTTLFAIIVVLVVQQLDNNIISPKVLGSSLQLHPVYVILAVIVASSLFGAMGLVFALPGMLILREIGLYLFRKRLYRDPNQT